MQTSIRILTRFWFVLLLATLPVLAQNTIFFSSQGPSGPVGPVQTTDDFIRADSVPVSGSWATSTTLCNLGIGSDTLYGATSAAFCGGQSTAIAYPNNQKAAVRMYWIYPGDFSYQGPVVRSNGGSTFYFAYAGGSADPQVYVKKDVAGTSTSLATFAFTYAEGDWLELDVSGSTLTVYQNGVSIGSTTDSSISSGRGGIVEYSSDGSPLGTSTSGFCGGSISLACPPALAMVTDNFTRANNQAFPTFYLTGGWHSDSHFCGMQILSNYAEANTNATVCGEYNNDSTYPAAQKASVTIHNIASGAYNYAGSAVRMDGLGNGYVVLAGGTMDPNIYIQKSVAGTRTTMGATFSYTFVAGDKIELDATGTSTTTLTLYVNGVSQGTRTDSSSPYTSGNAGMMIYETTGGSGDIQVSGFCGGPLTASC